MTFNQTASLIVFLATFFILSVLVYLNILYFTVPEMILASIIFGIMSYVDSTLRDKFIYGRK